MQLADRNRSSYMDRLADYSFFILLLTTFAFNHSIIGNAGIVLFLGVNFLLIIAKNKVYGSYYFFCTLIYIVYNYLLIMTNRSINSATSIAMTNTLVKNFVFAITIFNYLSIKNSMENTLKLYSSVVFLFNIYIVFLSKGNIFSSRLGSDAIITVLGKTIDYNSNSVSMITAYAYLISLYGYLENRKPRDLFFCLWFLMIVLLTGSRKGALMVFLGTIMLVFLLRPKSMARNIFISGIVVSLLLLATMYMEWPYSVIGSRLEEIFVFLRGANIKDPSMRTRISFIQRGWLYFLQRPWTGYGLDCFRHLRYAYGTYSHNNYIEILISGGIIGFIIYYFPLAVMCIKILKRIRKAAGVHKVVFVMFILQLAMEIAFVTYFERLPLIIIMFALASLKVYDQRVRYLRIM